MSSMTQPPKCFGAVKIEMNGTVNFAEKVRNSRSWVNMGINELEIFKFPLDNISI